MLVLSRRDGEQITIGDDVVIKVLGVAHGRVRVGIEAPREVPVRRGEIVDKSPGNFHETHRIPRAPRIVEWAGTVH